MILIEQREFSLAGLHLEVHAGYQPTLGVSRQQAAEVVDQVTALGDVHSREVRPRDVHQRGLLFHGSWPRLALCPLHVLVACHAERVVVFFLKTWLLGLGEPS